MAFRAISALFLAGWFHLVILTSIIARALGTDQMWVGSLMVFEEFVPEWSAIRQLNRRQTRLDGLCMRIG